LEDVVSRIETPSLNYTHITFFNQLVFHTPQLRHFISRTETFKAPHRADVFFSNNRVEVTLFRRKGTVDHRMLELRISSKSSEWQLSSLAQVCGSSLYPLSTLEHLGIHERRYPRQEWQSDMESTQWHELLHPFTSVKDLELSGSLVQRVARSLGELSGESLMQVLPALRNIFVTGTPSSEPNQEAFSQFVSTRQIFGHPVDVHHRGRREGESR
jgi:hypothetical protein